MFYRLTLPSGVLRQGLFGFRMGVLNPSQRLVPDTLVMELGCKAPVSHFVERHAEVQ